MILVDDETGGIVDPGLNASSCGQPAPASSAAFEQRGSHLADLARRHLHALVAEGEVGPWVAHRAQGLLVLDDAHSDGVLIMLNDALTFAAAVAQLCAVVELLHPW